MLPWLVVLAVALAATDAQDDLLDMASNWQGPDKVCMDNGSNNPISMDCTLPSGNVILELYRFIGALKISCSKNSTLVCDELQEAKPFFDKYKYTRSKDESIYSLLIRTCTLPRERLACLLVVVGANETDLVRVTLYGFAGKLEPVHLEGLEGVIVLDIYDADESVTSLPYNALYVLPNLEYFYMYNAFVKLTSETNHVLTKLTDLELHVCRIKSVPKGAFKAAPEIQKLTLTDNMIEFIDVDAFEGLTKLDILDLSENLLTHLPGGVFRHTPNIEYLYLNKNKLLDLSDDLFTGSNKLMQELSLSNNNLTISTEKNVRKVSSGFVSCCSSLTNLTKLWNLDLSHNNISVYCVNWPRSLSKLDLSFNSFTSFPPEVYFENNIKVDLRHNNIERIKLPNNKQDTSVVKYYYMAYNPYICDCNLYDSIHNNTLGTIMLDIEEAECAQPPELKGVKLANLQLEVLTCDVDCKTGDVILHPNNDSNCKCIKTPIQQRLDMFCDYLPDVFPKLPQKINYTYLKLRYVTDVPLLPAEVKIVDFSFLNLTEPPIANSVALNLTNNYLTKAPLELFQRNCSVYLSNNPFDCSCWGKDNVLALNAFKNLIPDYKNLTCSNGISVSNTVVEQLCATRNGIIISLSLSIVGILIITCTIIAFKYTTELRIILRGLGLWRGDVLGGEIYDAFVSFAHQDEDFVREKLLPKLEKGKPPLKICIHYRDWVIGDYIPDQIARSVEQSRYTIIVLSRNFVESMWGRMEFRTAHAKDRAIILMLDDLSADKSLDRGLRAYISTNTYVKADDPLVWERLRDAVLRRRRGNSKLNKLTTTVMDCDA